MREIYNGYSITYNEITRKYTARKGHKIFGSNADITALKYGIDAWQRNCELSDIIDRTPQGHSSNPNVIRKSEIDPFKGGY